MERVLWKKGPRRRTPRSFLQDPTRFLTNYVVYHAMYRTIKTKRPTLLRSKHTENIMCIPMILRRQVLSRYVYFGACPEHSLRDRKSVV